YFGSTYLPTSPRQPEPRKSELARGAAAARRAPAGDDALLDRYWSRSGRGESSDDRDDLQHLLPAVVGEQGVGREARPLATRDSPQRALDGQRERNERRAGHDKDGPERRDVHVVPHGDERQRELHDAGIEQHRPPRLPRPRQDYEGQHGRRDGRA